MMMVAVTLTPPDGAEVPLYLLYLSTCRRHWRDDTRKGAAHPAATDVVVVGTPGCSQPGEGRLVAADCAVTLSTSSGKRTSAEKSVPSPSRDLECGPSMEGGAEAMEQDRVRCEESQQSSKGHGRTRNEHEDNHAQAITNHSQIGHATRSVPKYGHVQVMRLHAVITTAHGSGAPVRVANLGGESGG